MPTQESQENIPLWRRGLKPGLLANLVFFLGMTALALRILALGFYGALYHSGLDLSISWLVLTGIDLFVLLITLLAYATTVVSSWQSWLHTRRRSRGAKDADDADDVSLIEKSEREAAARHIANAQEEDEDDDVEGTAGPFIKHVKFKLPVHHPGDLGSPRPLSRIFPSFLLLSNMFLFVSSIVLVATNANDLLTNSRHSDPRGVATIVCEATGALFTSLYFVVFIVSESMSFSMIAQTIVVMVSVLEILIAFVCIWVNSTSRLVKASRTVPSIEVDDVVHNSVGFPYYGLVIAATSAIGLTYGLSVNAYNRLSSLSGTLAYMYYIASGICEIICCVYFAFACANIADTTDYGRSFRDVMVADPIIAFSGMVLCIVGIFATISTRKRPRSSLKVEYYDLSKLSENQLAAWAALIDTYSQLLPGSVSGKEALSLMQAYVSSPTRTMHCKVLRVYDANRQAQLEREARKAAENGQLGGAAAKGYPGSDETPVPKYYEQVRAWEQLDRPAIFEDVASVNSRTDVATLVSTTLNKGRTGDASSGDAVSGKPLSKNAQKKAERKAEKKAEKRRSQNMSMKGATIDSELQRVDPEVLHRDEEFKRTLMATEALLLMTYIEDYDLTASLGDSTRFGRFVSRIAGRQSPFKFLCVRMGLLATHFPFRQAMLYTSPTRKPNARTAAVCMAVSEWNTDLPRSERCNMILNPAFAHKGTGDAFKPSGWLTVPLPPSHVVDLRQFQGKTMPQYLKAIKYRNQAVAFNKAKGRVVETTEFNYENCSIAMHLWANIAEKRTSDGHTAVLAKPSVEFLQSLGSTANSAGYRTLLFLKVDDKTIASCVLFRLGDTITSDIQGLDHETGRKYKAYFVMMQETIAIALREGINFVDFGPTTAKPKKDIGSKEVALVGGMWAQKSLAPLVSAFAGQVA